MGAFLPGIDMANSAKFIEPMEVVDADHASTTLKEFSRDLKEGRREAALRKSDARLDKTV